MIWSCWSALVLLECSPGRSWTPHYGAGVPLATAAEVLEGLLALPGVRALTLTEVNPTHDPRGAELERYVHAVADALLTALAPDGGGEAHRHEWSRLSPGSR